MQNQKKLYIFKETTYRYTVARAPNGIRFLLVRQIILKCEKNTPKAPHTTYLTTATAKQL